jgi:hypothetical protein
MSIEIALIQKTSDGFKLLHVEFFEKSMTNSQPTVFFATIEEARAVLQEMFPNMRRVLDASKHGELWA